jgi:hypothetical protein
MSRYNEAVILHTSQNKPYYKGKKYPEIPLSETDIYIISTVEDRLDLLAYKYYNDIELWWIIAAANNNVTKGSLFPIPGTQLRIPTDALYVIGLFNDINE